MALPDHGALSDFWESTSGEHDVEITEITGSLPPDLVGTLYHNGAGRGNVGSSSVDSLFDADGMVTAFSLDGSGVRFRNRFVWTKHYLKANKAGKLVQRGITRQRAGGILANAFRLPANTANTNVMTGPDSLFALHEVGKPHRLDPDTLETLGMCDLGGVLRGPQGAYSAHYCVDPATGSKVNFGFDACYPRFDPKWVLDAPDRGERLRRLRELAGEAIPRLRLRLYETDRHGQTRYLRSVPLPGLTRVPLIHDMALTARYAIFTVSPFRMDPLAILGAKSYWNSMSVMDDEPTYLLLAPRDGGPVRVVETEPFFSWHYANAYDDGTDVVVDLSRYSPATIPGMQRWTADVRSGLQTIYHELSAAQQSDSVQLARYRISLSGRVIREPLADIVCDFPQFDQRRATAKHAFSYVVALYASDTEGSGIARIDNHTGTVQKYCPPGHIMVEPTFVPRDAKSAEDDGWVLTVGYDEAAHRSRLMVFDAAHIDAGPLAEAWLPFHVPLRYHGAFTDRVMRRPD
ncbi:carotenoid oxygenase family protein [Nocardia sp. CA-128927]|uniref:carotenoid oxygenase family protein n=1 Tax=Nocardia sp. CA-128927 TaxID=3239975 RepID=UPI003D95A82A